MNRINSYIQGLQEIKAPVNPFNHIVINNEEFRKRAQQFEEETFLYESQQFPSELAEGAEGSDGGDLKTLKAVASTPTPTPTLTPTVTPTNTPTLTQTSTVTPTPTLTPTTEPFEPFWINPTEEPSYSYVGPVNWNYDGNSLLVSPKSSLSYFRSTSIPYGGYINAENCTNLTELFVALADVMSINVTNCINLTALRCQNNLLTDLNASNLNNLNGLFCFANPLTSINLFGCNNLTQFYCQNNSLSSLNISSCANLIDMRCNANNLTTTTVNSILTTLDAFGLNGGFVDLRFGTNATPSGSGLTAKTNLETRGWTIRVN